MKIPSQYDHRRKLSDSQKQQIVELYATSEYTMRYLADNFGVSQKTICLIVNDEAKEKQYAYMKKYKQTYSREQKNTWRRTYRKHRKELYKRGKLILTEQGDEE